MLFYPFFIKDFDFATRHLNEPEELAYRKLLDLYFHNEKPLNQSAHRLTLSIRMPPDREPFVQNVLNEFFVLTEDGYRNERADEVIKSYQDTVAKQRRRGLAGAQARWGNRVLIDCAEDVKKAGY